MQIKTTLVNTVILQGLQLNYALGHMTAKLPTLQASKNLVASLRAPNIY